MKKPLSLRIEEEFTEYLKAKLEGEEINIYAGHGYEDDLQFPQLVVYAEDSQPHPEMPRETGVRVVRLRVKLQVESDDGRAPIDQWRETVEDAMIDCPDYATEINTETSGVHVYDVLHGGEPSERMETDWVEDMLYDVTCQKMHIEEE